MISAIKENFHAASRKARRLRKLKDNTSGVAMVEFAYTLPIILSLGLLGSETAYYTITHMEVSQIAVQVADNASRAGEHDVLVSRQVNEDDVNQVLVGAEKLGERLDIYGRGRIILSSLERNDEGGQWIHWQRCRGAKNHASSYGVEGDGASGTSFPGMGDAPDYITASEGESVMFVELSYTYEALTPFDFLDGEEISYTAAFNVRDERDLTQIYPSPSGQNTASCSNFSADRP